MGSLWFEDDAFDLGHHVMRETLRAKPGEPPLQALKRRVAELAVQALDPSRPLWQLHLIEDVDAQRSGMTCRIHLCIGDGIALMAVTLSIADGGKPPPQRHQGRADEHEDLAHQPLKPITDLTVKAIGLAGHGNLSHIGPQVASDAAALAQMPDDEPTRLKGVATPGKRVAWCKPLPLADVKAVSTALAVSINDVLLACVAGAIGEYLRKKGGDPSGQEIRAMVPANLCLIDEAYKLGNRFDFAPLVLPIGARHPGERLYAVHQRMQQLKTSYQPLLAFALLAVASQMIKPMRDAITGLFARKATAEMTNVPGPREPIHFYGRTAKPMMFRGAAVEQRRHGRFDPAVRGRRAVRPHHRSARAPRSGSQCRRLCPGVREADLAGARMAALLQSVSLSEPAMNWPALWLNQRLTACCSALASEKPSR
jgi:WS/DGAT/MGAT family acyltransferase